MENKQVFDKPKQVTATGKLKISVNIPEKLLLELDLNRELIKQDRSTWVTSAIMEKLASIKKGDG